MRRRDFITLLGGAALTPSLARAQQKTRRLGLLMMFSESDAVSRTWVRALRQGLDAAGWQEGRNIQLDFRWVAQEPDSIQRGAKELVALQPEAIVSSSTATTRSLMQETRTIPIIFTNITDPIGSGFVASEAKPGGNITGFVNLPSSVTGKYLELLKEIAPGVKRAAMSYNPTTATYAETYLKPFRAAAASFGVEPSAAPVHNLAELEAFIATHARQPGGGLIAMPDGFNTRNGAEIAALALRYRLPLLHSQATAVRSGGLISYGNDQPDNYRRVATYVDRIFKGEKAGDLPVQLPVKFELAINLKTAKALDLEVPLFLQQRADEVIE